MTLIRSRASGVALSGDRVESFWTAATAAAVAWGVIVRSAQYFSRQSFWWDEISLLHNIVHKDTWGYFHGGLDEHQAAPPLFLTVQHALARLLGPGELSQRVVPMLLGISALTLFARLAWRLLPPPAAALATALFACSDRLIWHACEVKQYSGDVFFAVLFTYLALGYLAAPPDELSRHRFRTSALLAAGLIWFSHVVLLVFGGLAALFLVRESRRPRNIGRSLTALVPLAASFLVLYLASIRHQGADAYLRWFWSDSFVDWWNPLSIPAWLVGRLRDMSSQPLFPFEWLGALFIPLVVLGAYGWWRSGRWQWTAACVAPIVMNLAAAAVEAYPFRGGRLNLFLVPGLLLLSGAGVAVIEQDRSRHRGVVAICLVLPLLLVPLGGNFYHLAFPRNKGQVRPLVEYLRAHRVPGEPVYVIRSRYEFEWYWPDAPGPVRYCLRAPAQGSAKFWLLMSFKEPDRQDLSMRRELANLDARARRTDVFLVPGGAVVAYAR